ncbi:MAG TPA: serine hydrolase domain-containing protein [Tepidiformaceae bacterium]|nr:serine hydrolase domain-containing protein [Tepidiformaceae bacterium]
MHTDPAAAGFSPDRLNRITNHLNTNYIDTGKIVGCQALVSRYGTPAYFQSFGCADRERSTPMADDTIFRIYSMSKPITSIALMSLYERGLFQLNDPVSRAIPEWKSHEVWVSGDGDSMETRPPKQPMTFRHVLSHTGGLTYGGGLFPSAHPVDKAYQAQGVRRGKDETLSDFVRKLANVPLRYEPGQNWMYSLSTDVCGALVEILSGQPFDVFLEENIFTPLGMKDTSFWVAPEKANRLAANYQRGADKQLKLIDDPQTSTYLEKPAFLSGGGGLTSTTADYYRFCEMLRRGGELDGVRIIGSRTLELMTRNHLKDDGDLASMAIGAFSETAYEGVGFGLGFASTLDEVKAGSLGAGDFYWGGAASTIFWVDPIEDLVCIFMTQLMPSSTFNFRGQLKQIIYSAIED